MSGLRGLNVSRSGHGSERDLLESIWQNYKAGNDVGEAVTDALVDSVLQRYQGNITAMLRRGGMELEDGEALTVDTIVQLISDRTGIDLAAEGGLSEESITAAVDKAMARSLSAELGFDVTTVLDSDTLLAEVSDYVRTELSEGRGGGLLSGALVSQVRGKMTWVNEGLSDDERAAALNRHYQKKFRRTHKLVWG